MGHGAQANRRALIATTQECVNLANRCAAGVEETQAAYATVKVKLDEDLPALTRRLDAQAAWCARLEQDLRAQTERVSRLSAACHYFFADMTVRERLRWLLLGSLPVAFQLFDLRQHVTVTRERMEAAANVPPGAGSWGATRGPAVLP